MMIGEVNRNSDRHLRYFGLRRAGWVETIREYRRVAPQGRLHLYALAAGGLAVLFLIVVVAAAEISYHVGAL
jgi:hypothetical protein